MAEPHVLQDFHKLYWYNDMGASKEPFPYISEVFTWTDHYIDQE